MAKERTVPESVGLPVICPFCGREFDYTMYPVIKIPGDNRLKKQLLNKDLYFPTCPYCREQFKVKPNCVYFDARKAEMFIVTDASDKKIVEMVKTGDILPEDVRIVESMEVASEFHPRHCDTEKTYEYRVLNTKMPVPIRRLYTYHFSMPLDEEKMQEAAEYLVGEHDFTSFCNVESQAASHVRTIKDITVARNGDEVIISVTGNGFLYNMVRIIAGTLILVGRGKKEPSEVKRMLESRDRKAAGPTAPPEGLFLIKYKFLDGVPTV